MPKKHYFRPKAKYQEDAEAKRAEMLKAMRVHLRKTREDFLAALNVKEGDERYDELLAIWSQFHED